MEIEESTSREMLGYWIPEASFQMLRQLNDQLKFLGLLAMPRSNGVQSSEMLLPLAAVAETYLNAAETIRQVIGTSNWNEAGLPTPDISANGR